MAAPKSPYTRTNLPDGIRSHSTDGRGFTSAGSESNTADDSAIRFMPNQFNPGMETPKKYTSSGKNKIPILQNVYGCRDGKNKDPNARPPLPKSILGHDPFNQQKQNPNEPRNSNFSFSGQKNFAKLESGSPEGDLFARRNSTSSIYQVRVDPTDPHQPESQESHQHPSDLNNQFKDQITTPVKTMGSIYRGQQQAIPGSERKYDSFEPPVYILTDSEIEDLLNNKRQSVNKNKLARQERYESAEKTTALRKVKSEKVFFHTIHGSPSQISTTNGGDISTRTIQLNNGAVSQPRFSYQTTINNENFRDKAQRGPTNEVFFNDTKTEPEQNQTTNNVPIRSHQPVQSIQPITQPAPIQIMAANNQHLEQRVSNTLPKPHVIAQPIQPRQTSNPVLRQSQSARSILVSNPKASALPAPPMSPPMMMRKADVPQAQPLLQPALLLEKNQKQVETVTMKVDRKTEPLPLRQPIPQRLPQAPQSVRVNSPPPRILPATQIKQPLQPVVQRPSLNTNATPIIHEKSAIVHVPPQNQVIRRVSASPPPPQVTQLGCHTTVQPRQVIVKQAEHPVPKLPAENYVITPQKVVPMVTATKKPVATQIVKASGEPLHYPDVNVQKSQLLVPPQDKELELKLRESVCVGPVDENGNQILSQDVQPPRRSSNKRSTIEQHPIPAMTMIKKLPDGFNLPSSPRSNSPAVHIRMIDGKITTVTKGQPSIVQNGQSPRNKDETPTSNPAKQQAPSQGVMPQFSSMLPDQFKKLEDSPKVTINRPLPIPKVAEEVRIQPAFENTSILVVNTIPSELSIKPNPQEAEKQVHQVQTNFNQNIQEQLAPNHQAQEATFHNAATQNTFSTGQQNQLVRPHHIQGSHPMNQQVHLFRPPQQSYQNQPDISRSSQRSSSTPAHLPPQSMEHLHRQTYVEQNQVAISANQPFMKSIGVMVHGGCDIQDVMEMRDAIAYLNKEVHRLRFFESEAKIIPELVQAAQNSRGLENHLRQEQEMRIHLESELNRLRQVESDFYKLKEENEAMRQQQSSMKLAVQDQNNELHPNSPEFAPRNTSHLHQAPLNGMAPWAVYSHAPAIDPILYSTFLHPNQASALHNTMTDDELKTILSKLSTTQASILSRIGSLASSPLISRPMNMSILRELEERVEKERAKLGELESERSKMEGIIEGLREKLRFERSAFKEREKRVSEAESVSKLENTDQKITHLSFQDQNQPAQVMNQNLEKSPPVKEESTVDNTQKKPSLPTITVNHAKSSSNIHQNVRESCSPVETTPVLKTQNAFESLQIGEPAFAKVGEVKAVIIDDVDEDHSDREVSREDAQYNNPMVFASQVLQPTAIKSPYPESHRSINVSSIVPVPMEGNEQNPLVSHVIDPRRISSLGGNSDMPGGRVTNDNFAVSNYNANPQISSLDQEGYKRAKRISSRGNTITPSESDKKEIEYLKEQVEKLMLINKRLISQQNMVVDTSGGHSRKTSNPTSPMLKRNSTSVKSNKKDGSINDHDRESNQAHTPEEGSYMKLDYFGTRPSIQPNSKVNFINIHKDQEAKARKERTAKSYIEEDQEYTSIYTFTPSAQMLNALSQYGADIEASNRLMVSRQVDYIESRSHTFGNYSEDTDKNNEEKGNEAVSTLQSTYPNQSPILRNNLGRKPSQDQLPHKPAETNPRQPSQSMVGPAANHNRKKPSGGKSELFRTYAIKEEETESMIERDVEDELKKKDDEISKLKSMMEEYLSQIPQKDTKSDGKTSKKSSIKSNKQQTISQNEIRMKELFTQMEDILDDRQSEDSVDMDRDDLYKFLSALREKYIKIKKEKEELHRKLKEARELGLTNKHRILGCLDTIEQMGDTFERQLKKMMETSQVSIRRSQYTGARESEDELEQS